MYIHIVSTSFRKNAKLKIQAQTFLVSHSDKYVVESSMKALALLKGQSNEIV
jgi:hypothetical protein